MENFITYNFDKITILTSIHVHSNKATPIHRNRKSHGLVYNYDGIMKYKFDNGRILTVEKNNIIYLPKGANYIIECIESGGCYAINFDSIETLSFSPFIFIPRNLPSFLNLFKQSEYLWRSKKIGYYEKSMQQFYSIIFDIKNELNIEYLPKEKSKKLIPAIEFINNNYIYETIKISNLAEICNMSEVYFRKIFKQTYGISPLKYICNLKLMRAKELILTGHYTIKEVATLSGFLDDSYFGREFKKEFGVSPNKFAKCNIYINNKTDTN